MTDIVDRLRRQVSESPYDGFVSPLEAADEIERLEADNERLRAALKPFSAASDSYDDEPPARVIASQRGSILSVCDLRAAKAALG